MNGKLVRDVMAFGVPACKPDCPLVEVARVLSEEERDILVVMGDRCIEGVVSQSDLARVFLSDYHAMTAKDVMSPGMYSVSPDALLSTAVEMLVEKGLHQVLVVPDSEECTAPAGVLSKRHLVELMAEQE
jgi:CBS domain-containing protein